jgi:hypothetical protein
MAAVLEECIAEEQLSVVRFLLTKVHNARGIHEEIFPVYCGKFLSRKALHSWFKNLPP